MKSTIHLKLTMYLRKIPINIVSEIKFPDILDTNLLPYIITTKIVILECINQVF